MTILGHASVLLTSAESKLLLTLLGNVINLAGGPFSVPQFLGTDPTKLPVLFMLDYQFVPPLLMYYC